MEKNKIDDFFKILEKVQREQKVKEYIKIIIPIFKNDKGMYNIYFGIEKKCLPSSTYASSVFVTEKEFLESGYQVLLEDENCFVLEDVKEEELYKILFAFNMKYFAGKADFYKSIDENLVEKYSSDDNIFDKINVSVVFSKNIIDSSVRVNHIAGVCFNKKFKENELLEESNYEERKKIIKNYYLTDYKYYLEILNQMENKATNPIKMAYRFANYDILDKYVKSKKVENRTSTKRLFLKKLCN